MRVSAILFLLLIAPVAALAQISQCRTFFDGDAALSAEGASLLRTLPHGHAVQKCRQHDEVRYYVLSRPRTGMAMVCRYDVAQFVRHSEDWKWDRTAGTSMMVATAGCPRQDDPRYLHVSGVSEGIFIAIMQFWQHLATGSVSDVPQALSAVSSGDFEDFKSAQDAGLIRTGALKPSHLTLDRDHYGLVVNGPTGNWLLVLDLVEGEIQLLAVGRVYY